MSYNNKILKYYNIRKNSGSLELENNYGLALIGSPICGDFIELKIHVVNDIIINSKFKTYGCGSAIASISLLVSYIIKKNINLITYIKNTHILKELNLPLIKIHCSILAEDILNFSISNFKNNYLII